MAESNHEIEGRQKRIQKSWNIYTLISFLAVFVFIMYHVVNNTWLPGLICEFQDSIKTDGEGCYLMPNFLVPFFLYLLIHTYIIKTIVEKLTGVKLDIMKKKT